MIVLFPYYLIQKLNSKCALRLCFFYLPKLYANIRNKINYSTNLICVSMQKKIFHGIAHMNKTGAASRFMFILKLCMNIPKVHFMRLLGKTLACVLLSWII